MCRSCCCCYCHLFSKYKVRIVLAMIMTSFGRGAQRVGRSLTKCVRQTFSLCENRRCPGQRKVSLFMLCYVMLFYFISRFIFPFYRERRSILLYFNSVCISSHRSIMSTCVTYPVTLISTTTSSLPVFNLMTSLSLTSWVTRFPGDWRILMIGRLPLVSMTSKRTGLAKQQKVVILESRP